MQNVFHQQIKSKIQARDDVFRVSHLSDPLSTLLTKLSWVAKVLNKVWQQTQHIERESCTERYVSPSSTITKANKKCTILLVKEPFQLLAASNQPIDCELSTTGTRETGVS